MSAHPHCIEHALIHGEWVDGGHRSKTEVYNPHSGEILGSVPSCEDVDVSKAIAHAHEQWLTWKKEPPHQRCDTLNRWAELCKENEEQLAELITLEQGKPLAEARGEIRYGTSFLAWFAEEGKRSCGFTIPHPNSNNRIVVQKEAVGVVGAITPWNFPNAMITRKVGPAIAAGCPIVLKPAPQTPFSALALAKLGLEAGLPPAALQVITGSAEMIGQTFCADRRVRKLSFTGSTAVGSQLMAQSAQHIKRLSLELGGNAPFIIFEDADLDAACTGLMMAKFRNAGQTCVSANRIYVQHNIKAKLIEKLLPRIQELKTGSGFDHQTSLGPLIDNSALEKVNRHIQSALDEGAVLLSGGIASSAQTCEATLLDLVPHESAFLKEETFGPVCPIISFETEDQVVDQANATDAGLVAYFYSQNQRRCTRVSEALDFGMIGINEGLISNAVAPFGGIKASGLGREGSMAGLDEYLELKYTCSSV